MRLGVSKLLRVDLVVAAVLIGSVEVCDELVAHR